MTPQGWIAFAALAVTVLGIIIRFVIGIARTHITMVVQQQVDESVKATIRDALDPIQLQLTTMAGELGRVRLIEQKIENGLADRTANIEVAVRDIQQHLMWDGTTERRQT